MTEATVDGGTSTDSSSAARFPQATREQWQRLVVGVLRKSRVIGDDETPDHPENLLASTTYNGITLSPLYTADDADGPSGFPGLFPFVRGSRPDGSSAEGWDVRQLHADPDPADTAQAVLTDLENGVASVFLRVGSGAVRASDLPQVLAEVLLDLAPVVLETGTDFTEAADALLRVWRDRGIEPSQVRGNLGADPLSVLARTGASADLAGAAALALRAHAEFPRLQAIAVDGQPYHEAGASEAQELAAVTAAGLAYLRALTHAGADVPTALDLVEFRFAAGADQFLTIAKLRAARRIWARVAEACGAPESGAQRQHAITSWAMTTRRDPWVNMLRTTVAAFAAGVGGADAVTVRPFDAALGLPDAFARRIARNTQSLLLEESNLAAVIDPAGGSWYVERLTEDLAQAGWEQFQRIEAAGGIVAALESGTLARDIATVRARRASALAHRTDAITGVSEFPNLDEELPSRAPAAPPAGGGLPRLRYAQPYEDLRDRSDAVLAATGVRPTAFVAALGPVAQHTARAGFVRNLLAAGGIETAEPVPTSVGADTAGEVVTAWEQAGRPALAVLASADRIYAEHAAPAASALKAAGARRVLLAGKGGRNTEAWAAAGVDGYVFTGCDALAVLDDAYQTLEANAR